MIAAERAAALALIGWTRQELANRLRVHHSVVGRWLETADAPVWVDRWLATAARWMSGHMKRIEPMPPAARGRPRKPTEGKPA